MRTKQVKVRNSHLLYSYFEMFFNYQIQEISRNSTNFVIVRPYPNFNWVVSIFLFCECDSLIRWWPYFSGTFAINYPTLFLSALSFSRFEITIYERMESLSCTCMSPKAKHSDPFVKWCYEEAVHGDIVSVTAASYTQYILCKNWMNVDQTIKHLNRFYFYFQ